jgi:hypothetical protein
MGNLNLPGAKMDDELAYDRIFTTDEDKSGIKLF